MKTTIAMLGTASVLALAVASAAQAGTIAGRVTDASETIGLAGATVRILETGQTATVGSDGTFRVTGLAAGEYTLRVSYVGADAREVSVNLATVTDTVSPTITLGDDVDYVDNILVMGQRGALNSALSRQRANDGNIAVLSSDAIGQFPDENVAEAARRAVGVNVLNDQGEGRFVSIRGLDPNLVSTSINGVRLVSPEAEDRQVGLDVIDADVLSSVVINKSLLPNMDGDSVGGNVEIETMSGLDVDGVYLRARVAALYSDLEQEFGHRGSINWANNFMDGRLGVAASLSHQERVFGSDSFEVDGG
ncbi:TonB-dependent receptor [uncultured Maricaulis sp.]|uniref:TonB-dependent receptor n=1 Tax=uncultured Maricaulis sp. TaxID=174710 RepID=UPI0026274D4E|nr:TonB-dependent receptor [uncultured Maricaulis sp.]